MYSVQVYKLSHKMQIYDACTKYRIAHQEKQAINEWIRGFDIVITSYSHLKSEMIEY